MEIIPSDYFEKCCKGLHKNQKKDLDDAVGEIVKNPAIGDEKWADLTGIRVFKFHMLKQLTLLSYVIYRDKYIVLLTLGSHQNYYGELKHILKNTKVSDFIRNL
jgi:hypothetical protein